MAYLGTGAPLIKYKNKRTGNIKTIQLPRPRKGGREEEYEDETNKKTNPITGQILKGEKRLRFTGKYQFNRVSTDIIDKLIQMDNKTDEIMFYPTGSLVRFDCHFNISPKPLKGYIKLDTITLEVRESQYRQNKPTLDTAVLGRRQPHRKATVDKTIDVYVPDWLF